MQKEVKIKKRKLSKKSPPKPTPRGLPTLKRLNELMKGVDLWDMDKPPEVVAEGRKSRRPWPINSFGSFSAFLILWWGFDLGNLQ